MANSNTARALAPVARPLCGCHDLHNGTSVKCYQFAFPGLGVCYQHAKEIDNAFEDADLVDHDSKSMVEAAPKPVTKLRLVTRTPQTSNGADTKPCDKCGKPLPSYFVHSTCKECYEAKRAQSPASERRPVIVRDAVAEARDQRNAETEFRSDVERLYALGGETTVQNDYAFAGLKFTQRADDLHPQYVVVIAKQSFTFVDHARAAKVTAVKAAARRAEEERLQREAAEKAKRRAEEEKTATETADDGASKKGKSGDGGKKNVVKGKKGK